MDINLSQEEEEFWSRERKEGQAPTEGRDTRTKRGSSQDSGPDKKAKKGEGKFWLGARTLKRLHRAIDFERMECSVCALRLTTEKRLKVHVRQHYIHNFCRCGARRHSRDSMLDHIRDHKGQPGHSTEVIECDADNFPALKKLMEWDGSVTFPECRPTLVGPRWKTATDTRAKIETRKKERRERVADRLGKQTPRITTSPPASRSPTSEAPVIRVRRLALPEVDCPDSNSRVESHPLEEPTSSVPTTTENEWMWACYSSAATLEAEADQLEEKVSALRKKAATFRGLATNWRKMPEPTE